MRKNRESSDSERSFTVVERMSVGDKQEHPQRNTCNDDKSEPANDGISLAIAHTIAKSPVNEDNNKSTVTNDMCLPTEITDDDVHVSGSETKMVVENLSKNSDNTYAQIDKTRKDLKRKEVSKYEQVLGFVPRIDHVENLTGSDTFMSENDLYGKVIPQSQPSKTPEMLNETIRVDTNNISDAETGNNCECVDSNGSPKEEMKEELKENTYTRLEKHGSNCTDNSDGNNVTEHEEIACR